MFATVTKNLATNNDRLFLTICALSFWYPPWPIFCIPCFYTLSFVSLEVSRSLWKVSNMLDITTYIYLKVKKKWTFFIEDTICVMATWTEWPSLSFFSQCLILCIIHEFLPLLLWNHHRMLILSVNLQNIPIICPDIFQI